MPARIVDQNDSVGAGRHFGRNLSQQQIHGFTVGKGKDEGGAGVTRRTDCPEDIGGLEARVAAASGALAALPPDTGQAAFLPDPRFILKPDLNPAGFGVLVFDGCEDFLEVFLKAA